MHYLAPPSCPVELPPDRLTVEEVAAIRRALPKLLQAVNGACPILANLS